jgi:hypothetical protein
MRREPRDGRDSSLIRIPDGIFGKCIYAGLFAAAIAFAYVWLTTPEKDFRLANSFELRRETLPKLTTPSPPAPNPPLHETQPTVPKIESPSLAPVPDIPIKLTEQVPIPPQRPAGKHLPPSRHAPRHQPLDVSPRSPDEIPPPAYRPAAPLPQICLPPFFLFMSPQELRACGMLPLGYPPPPGTSDTAIY